MDQTGALLLYAGLGLSLYYRNLFELNLALLTLL